MVPDINQYGTKASEITQLMYNEIWHKVWYHIWYHIVYRISREMFWSKSQNTPVSLPARVRCMFRTCVKACASSPKVYVCVYIYIYMYGVRLDILLVVSIYVTKSLLFKDNPKPPSSCKPRHPGSGTVMHIGCCVYYQRHAQLYYQINLGGLQANLSGGFPSGNNDGYIRSHCINDWFIFGWITMVYCSWNLFVCDLRFVPLAPFGSLGTPSCSLWWSLNTINGTICRSSPPKIIHHQTTTLHRHPQMVSAVAGFGVSQWIYI